MPLDSKERSCLLTVLEAILILYGFNLPASLQLSLVVLLFITPLALGLLIDACCFYFCFILLWNEAVSDSDEDMLRRELRLTIPDWSGPPVAPTFAYRPASIGLKVG